MKILVKSLLVVLLLLSCDSTSDGNKGKLKVLLASNSSSDLSSVMGTWSGLMPNFEFCAVRNDTLTADDLDGIDVVVLWQNGYSQSDELAGNVLAPWVQSGGKLILGTFYGQGRGDNATYPNNYTYGALELIDPVSGHVDAYDPDTLIVKGNHALFSGVTMLVSDYGGGDTLLVNGGKLIKMWDTDRYDMDYILAAYTENNGRILYLSLWPNEAIRDPEDVYDPNEHFRLWANAIRWVDSKSSSTSDFDKDGNIEDEGNGDVLGKTRNKNTIPENGGSQ